MPTPRLTSPDALTRLGKPTAPTGKVKQSAELRELLEARAKELHATGEFTIAQLAKVVGISKESVKYLLMPPRKKQSKLARQREIRQQDPDYVELENIKRRQRREVQALKRKHQGELLAHAEMRTKPQKIRDQAIARPRDRRGRLVSASLILS